MRVALGIDSNYEPLVDSACRYRNANVYRRMTDVGIVVRLCQGRLARRIYTAPEAAKADVNYITGIGHGDATTYKGDAYDHVFEVGVYGPLEVAGKIVHFLSCTTAQTLGPDFVRHGCRAYFGYDKSFIFVKALAATYFECDSEIDRSFADGRTANDVYNRTVALFDRRIAELRAAHPPLLDEAALLEFDRRHLCAPAVDSRWGDGSATL